MPVQPKPGRRGFLGGILTWAAFQTRAAELAGVTLPKNELDMPVPTQVYMVNAAAIDNSDEGCYTQEDGIVGIRLFYSEAAAETHAKALNRHHFRTDFETWYGDYYAHCFLDRDIEPAAMAVIRRWAPKLLSDWIDDDVSEYTDAEILEALCECAGDTAGAEEKFFPAEMPVEDLDVFIDCSSMSPWSVEAVAPHTVDMATVE